MVSNICLRELQIKMQMGYCTHLSESLKSRTLERQELSVTAGGDEDGAATLEDNVAVSTKPSTPLPYDPGIMLLGIYSSELKTMSTQSLQMEVDRALFVIAKAWKQPQCHSIGEWVNGRLFSAEEE